MIISVKKGDFELEHDTSYFKYSLVKYNGHDSEVIIPEEVNEIDSNAFNGCECITSIVLPKHIRIINSGTFSGCTSLKNIKITGNPSEIEFTNPCIHINNGEGLTIWNNGLYIGQGDNPYYLFLRPQSMDVTRVIVNDDTKVVAGMAFKPHERKEENKVEEIVLPDGIEKLCWRTFEGCGCLKSIRLPQKIDNIERGLFDDCISLEEVVIDGPVRSIDKYAFRNCTSLTAIRLPKSVETIGDEAFYNCTSLKDIDLHRVREFGKSAFENCTSLEKVRLSKGAKFNYSAKGSWYIIGCTPFMGCMGIHEFIAPSIPLDKYSNEKHLQKVAFQSYLSHKEMYKDKNVIKSYEDYGRKHGFGKVQESTETVNTDSDREAEKKAAANYKQEDMYLETLKVCKKGLKYSDGSNEKCSLTLLKVLLNEYVKEFYRVGKEYVGDMSSRIDISDDAVISKSDLADELASSLDMDELRAFLKKPAYSASYRPYIIAYARYATEDDILEYCKTINQKKRGTKREKYQASNMLQALYISDTAAAFDYIEKNGDINKYAQMRGMTPDEYKYTVLISAKDIDPKEKEKMRKDCKQDILKLYLRNEALSNDLWNASFAKHPVLNEFARRVIWADEKGNIFVLGDDGPIDINDKQIDPEGSIRPAHVLDMTSKEIEDWQEYLRTHQLSLLIDQVWEPIIEYNPKSLRERYHGMVLTNKDRSKIKSALKQKGIIVKSDENKGEYDHYQGEYIFSDTNKMNLGSSMTLTYYIDQDSGDITFGSDLKLKRNASKYEVNSILFEMDRMAVKNNISKDEDNGLQEDILDTFTASVKNCSQKVSIESPIMIRRPVVQGFL